jgi:hypothetical protein
MGAISKGKLSISRTSSNKMDKDFITMTIHDAESGLGVVTAEMSLEQFAEALTGVHRTEIDKIEVYNNFDNIGKELETKTVGIDYVPSDDFELTMAVKVKPYEKDGWIAQIQPFNSRKYQFVNQKYPILFKRYVEKSDK